MNTITLERTYRRRRWHRWENVIIGQRHHIAIRGYTFRRSGEATTRASIKLYPVVTRRIEYHVGEVLRLK